MDSILTNSTALSALQSLNITQQDLNITQNQVSTGLAVATAADNAAYWSIGQQLTSANGIETAADTALQQSQAIMDTANSAIASVITTIDSIQAAITNASNPGASFSDINDQLASLSNQLTQAINGASFNGVNLLNGSQGSTMNFVSGYDASASGGSVSSVVFTTQALVGGQSSAGSTTTSATNTVADSNLISQLEGLNVNGGTLGAANTNGNSTATTYTVAANVIALTSTDAAGDATVATYTALQANGQAAANTLAFSATNTTGAASWQVSTTTTYATPATPQGLLIQTGATPLQGNYNLTQLGSGSTTSIQVSSTNASDMLSAVNAALLQVRGYAASIGSAQGAMTAAATFNSAVSTDYANGLSALVDADMNTASTRLQALQTQEQLGIQSLSIANQNSQLILKLFNG
jgi:flagellin